MFLSWWEPELVWDYEGQQTNLSSLLPELLPFLHPSYSPLYPIWHCLVNLPYSLQRLQFCKAW